VEFGKIGLQVEETNITVFVRDLKNSFNELAAEKELAYTFLSYFCQAFRDYYGVTPKEYAGMNKTIESG
jgi:AraC-like DNA-binding protein